MKCNKKFNHVSEQLYSIGIDAIKDRKGQSKLRKQSSLKILQFEENTKSKYENYCKRSMTMTK